MSKPTKGAEPKKAAPSTTMTVEISWAERQSLSPIFGKVPRLYRMASNQPAMNFPHYQEEMYTAATEMFGELGCIFIIGDYPKVETITRPSAAELDPGGLIVKRYLITYIHKVSRSAPTAAPAIDTTPMVSGSVFTTNAVNAKSKRSKPKNRKPSSTASDAGDFAADESERKYFRHPCPLCDGDHSAYKCPKLELAKAAIKKQGDDTDSEDEKDERKPKSKSDKNHTSAVTWEQYEDPANYGYEEVGDCAY